MLFICIHPSGFFFCLISVISNQHKMTIKGFFNEKKITFIGWFSSITGTAGLELGRGLSRSRARVGTKHFKP